MKNKQGFVIMKQNCETNHTEEIMSICLTRDDATNECLRLQMENDIHFKKWRFVYAGVEIKQNVDPSHMTKFVDHLVK